MKNEYIPFESVIESIREETLDTKTFRVSFIQKDLQEGFLHVPGQFMEVSIPGIGEAPISISSSPHAKGHIELTIRACGSLTESLHQLKAGERMYLRGPYGRGFPVDEHKGRNLYFIAGGIGLAPLKGLIDSAVMSGGGFSSLKILYGAKTPGDLCFKEELKNWVEDGFEVFVTVDRADADWIGNRGVVTELWDKTSVKGENAVSYVCGPPVMMSFVIGKLIESGFKEDSIYLSLERYMKCGIGKCGHCNIGKEFVCIDGPVFSCGELKGLPAKELAF